MNASDDLSAAAQRVDDGMLVGLAAGSPPLALVCALIRRGARDLRVVTAPTGGLEVDLLIGAGSVAALESSGVSLGEYGLAPNFERAVRARAIALRDASCPVVLAALQAGAAGVPFAPVPGLIGSEILRVRPDYTTIQNPFAPDERVVVVPAIRPDVALLHALRAEPSGAAVFSAHGDAVLLGQASRRVIVTAEAVYEGATAVLAPDERLLAAIYVDLVVTAPRGCWPLGLGDACAPDRETLSAYLAAARSPETFLPFLKEFLQAAPALAGSR